MSTSVRWPRRLGVIALLATLALAAISGGTASAARFRTKTVRVRSGLVWKRIVDRSGPNRINALIVKPGGSVSLDVRAAGPTIPAVARTSAMARKARALAAVNGDYGGASYRRPIHPFLRRGDLVQTGLHIGNLFAFTEDQHTAFFGRPDLSITVDDGSPHKPRRIAAWNGGQPTLQQMVAFTDAGGTIEVPPNDACSARLYTSADRVWAPGGYGMQNSYTVDVVRCAAESLSTQGGVVVSTLPTSKRAPWLQSLTPGQQLTITGSVGWPDAFNGIGGIPLILQAGVLVAPTVCNPAAFCERNPRTAVGATDGCSPGHADTCKVIVLTVDGRRPGYSVGMTFPELAAQFQRLGATWALNLDGGGSTTMWVKGHGVVNRPSDGKQRRIPNSLLVVPS